MYYVKLNNKLENFKVNNNFILENNFLKYIKKYINQSKYLSINLKLNGCKGYIYNFNISKIKRDNIILNFKNLNILINFKIIFYLINSKINIIKKNKKLYIIVFLKKIIKCNCGVSFKIK